MITCAKFRIPEGMRSFKELCNNKENRVNTTPANVVWITDEEEQVSRYLPFADSVVRSVTRNLPPYVDEADLLSAGRVGMLKALRGFNSSKGVTFEAFARHRIRGAVLDELRRVDTVPRTFREKTKQVHEAENRLANVLSRKPTESEMAQEMGLNLSDYRQFRREILPVNFLYLDGSPFWGSCQEDDDISDRYHDSVADQSIPFGDEIERRDMLREIFKVVQSFSQQQQQVLTLYYLEGLTLREIGEALGFTESYACLVHKAAIKMLREHFQREGQCCTLAG